MSDFAAFPFSKVKSVKDIEALADTDFVRCAYLKILGREPDADGGRHYLSMIRRGYSKLTVLARLSESEEARERIPVLDGLDRALAAQRRRGSTWGKVSAAISRSGDDPFSRRRRAFWNFLEAQYASMDRYSSNQAAWHEAAASDSSEPLKASQALIEAIELAIERSAAEPVEAMRDDVKTRLLRIESLLLRRGRSAAALPEQSPATPSRKAGPSADRATKRI